jgi:hypothetical protein
MPWCCIRFSWEGVDSSTHFGLSVEDSDDAVSHNEMAKKKRDRKEQTWISFASVTNWCFLKIREREGESVEEREREKEREKEIESESENTEIVPWLWQ